MTYERARELRRRMTLPEVLLWQALRKRRLARSRFRRQHPIGRYILDFYCPGARLAVEVNGRGHDIPGQLRHDTRRDAWLTRKGVTVLRVAAADMLRDEKLEEVLVGIEQAISAPPSRSARHLPRRAGEEHRRPSRRNG